MKKKHKTFIVWNVENNTYRTQPRISNCQKTQTNKLQLEGLLSKKKKK